MSEQWPHAGRPDDRQDIAEQLDDVRAERQAHEAERLARDPAGVAVDGQRFAERMDKWGEVNGHGWPFVYRQIAPFAGGVPPVERPVP